MNLREHERWWQDKEKPSFLDAYDKVREPLFNRVVELCSGSVLDVGGGSGKLYEYLKKASKGEGYTMLEITSKFVGYVKFLYPEIKVDHGTALEMPYEDNQFGTSVAVALLRHILPDDMPKVMSELQRVAEKTVIGWALTPQHGKATVKPQGFVDVIHCYEDVLKTIKNPLRIEKIGRYTVYEIQRSDTV